MKHISETTHTLEIKRRPELTYVRVTDGIYQPAILLAWHGRLSEAIEEVEEICVHEHGDMIGVSFRVVTKTRTVTFHGPFEDADFR